VETKEAIRKMAHPLRPSQLLRGEKVVLYYVSENLNTCPNSFITCVKPSPLFPNFKPLPHFNYLNWQLLGRWQGLPYSIIDFRSHFFQ